MRLLFRSLFIIPLFVALQAVAMAGLSDIAGHAYETHIRDIHSRGIVSGYADGTYKPDATVNRAEFTKIVVGAQFSQSDIDACAWNNALTDVESGVWYQQYLCVAVENQVIGGYSDGTFRGGNTINFAEAAKIMVESFDIAYQQDAEFWYKGYIEALGVIGALPKTYDRADQSVTRGELAFMISQTLAYQDKKQVDAGNVSYEEITPASAAARIGNGMPMVVFFHASWCPKCVAKNEWLTNYFSGENAATVSVFKVDYDAAIDLKRQHGVVQQDTFILFDGDGQEITRASFPSEADLQDMLENGIT